MNDIINFTQEKQNIELTDLLERYEKIMPTPEEIEQDIDKLCNKYNLNRNHSDESVFLSALHQLHDQLYKNLIDAYYETNVPSKFSLRQLDFALHEYDICHTILSDYLLDNYAVESNPITKLDEILVSVKNLIRTDITMNMTSVQSIETIQTNIKRSIPVIEQFYSEFFALLNNHDDRCSSLDFYSLMISQIDYHLFKQYYRLCYEQIKSQTN